MLLLHPFFPFTLPVPFLFDAYLWATHNTIVAIKFLTQMKEKMNKHHTWSERGMSEHFRQYRLSQRMVQLYVEWYIVFVVMFLCSNHRSRWYRWYTLLHVYNLLKWLHKCHFDPLFSHRLPNVVKDMKKKKFVEIWFSFEWASFCHNNDKK